MWKGCEARTSGCLWWTESVQLRREELEGQWAAAAASSSVSLRATGSGEFGAREKDNLRF